VESSHFQGQRSVTYICMEEPHIHDCVYSGKVPYEDNNRVASWRIFVWSHQFKSPSLQPRV